MNYMQTFNRVLEIRRIQPYLMCHFGKYFSAVLTPIFIYYNISANVLTISRFILSIFSLVGLLLYYTEYFSLFLFCYWVMSWLLDFVDGDIARVQNKSTFVGNYLDGLFDLLLNGLLFICLGFIVYKIENNILYYFLGTYGCIGTLLSNLNIDRYSAFRRWILEEQKIDIGTHLMSKPLKIIRSSYNNLRPTLIIILFCIGYNFMIIQILLWVGAVWNTIYFSYYVLLFVKNAHLIIDKPRHDGTGRKR